MPICLPITSSCIYIPTRVCAYPHLYLHTYLRLFTYLYPYLCMYLFLRTYIYTYIFVLTCIRTYLPKYMSSYNFVCTYAHIATCTYVHVYLLTCPRTHYPLNTASIYIYAYPRLVVCTFQPFLLVSTPCAPLYLCIRWPAYPYAYTGATLSPMYTYPSYARAYICAILSSVCIYTPYLLLLVCLRGYTSSIPVSLPLLISTSSAVSTFIYISIYMSYCLPSAPLIAATL